jgi:hypothetical protein
MNKCLWGGSKEASRIVDMLGLENVLSITLEIEANELAKLTVELLVESATAVEVYSYITKQFNLAEIEPK